MNAVGIDVSKGKSMASVIRPFGELVVKPYEVRHTSSELSGLASSLKSLEGETRVVLEHTGRYYEPVAQLLHDAGIFVSTGNPFLIKEYGNNSLRKAKKNKTAMKNNLIALLDQTYPGVNALFGGPARKDGSQKWVDFAASFWHVDYVRGVSQSTFAERYHKWCKTNY